MKILDMLKDSISPVLILLAAFFLTNLVLIPVFTIHSLFDDFMDATWQSWGNRVNIPKALGIVLIIILIATLVAGFLLWYMRDTWKIRYNTYIVYALMAVAGISLQLILYGININMVW